MLKLVSIIIPCFNAQTWLAEAIDSCLNQTYSNLEVIVVDDGSKDKSLEILKRYGNKITWETGPNRGGNYARNRGIALAKGEYIQFLDADDYILPKKIERQVRVLEETGADAVYGDWRYKTHLPNGSSYLQEIVSCGPKDDFLESLLCNDRWSNPAPVLFTRSAVEQSGGWDENLKAAQDRDFFLSVALTGAEFVYDPGCYSIYREYGRVTVSTKCRRRWMDSHCVVMEKAERKLAELGQLSLKYRHALAKGYFDMGREFLYSDFPHLDHNKYLNYLQVVDKALQLSPSLKPEQRNTSYNLIQQFLGCRSAEVFSYYSTRTKLSLKASLTSMQEESQSLIARMRIMPDTLLAALGLQVKMSQRGTLGANNTSLD